MNRRLAEPLGPKLGVTPIVVAIDGPAGSGKSSVSKQVARELGYASLDTGAAYRALAWFAADRGIDVDDPDAVVAALDDFDYRTVTDPDGFRAVVGGRDVTAEIRDPRVSATVSTVARIPEVRAALNERFRSIAAATAKPGIVIEGRDITTVVAPDAPVRILLTASEDARAARRASELGHAPDAVGEQLRSRDAADSQVVEFRTAADGVTTVDSTHLDFDATVAAIVDVVRRALV